MDVKITGQNSLAINPSPEERDVIKRGLRTAQMTRRLFDIAGLHADENLGTGHEYFDKAQRVDVGLELAEGHADVIATDLIMAGATRRVLASMAADGLAEEQRNQATQLEMLAGEMLPSITTLRTR